MSFTFIKASTFNYDFDVLRDEEDKFIYLLHNCDIVGATSSILNQILHKRRIYICIIATV